MSKRTITTEVPETKQKLVDAGVQLMRSRGFNATTVDHICAAAGVTKGGFFHYFKSKDELAAAAVVRFHELKEKEYAGAPFRKLTDPLDRVFARLDFAKTASGGERGVTKGCLLGMFAQEMSSTHSELRGLCQERFANIAKDFEADLAEAKVLYAPGAAFEPGMLAMMYVSIIQGSLLLAKASESNRVLVENIEQFRDYLQTLFAGSSQGKRPARPSLQARN